MLLERLEAFIDELQKIAAVEVGPPPEPNRKKWPYQGTINWPGLPEIRVENKRGTLREGKGKDGKPWKIKLTHHYGEFKGTKGADGDPVDVFVGRDEKAKRVFVVKQQDPATQEYEEDKVMLGFGNARAAKRGYLNNYDTSDFFGGMRRLSVAALADKLRVRNAGT